MEKIDIIDNIIYVYNTKNELIKSIDISTLDGLDLSYLSGSKLFTFNLNNPIKRVIKFTEVNDINIEAKYTEFVYDDMTKQQKQDFDNFVLLINSLS